MNGSIDLLVLSFDLSFYQSCNGSSWFLQVVDGVATTTIMVDRLTTGRFPSGSCENLNITNNAFEEVHETIGFLETILAVLVVGQEGGGDGGNDESGVEGRSSS